MTPSLAACSSVYKEWYRQYHIILVKHPCLSVYKEWYRQYHIILVKHPCLSVYKEWYRQYHIILVKHPCLSVYKEWYRQYHIILVKHPCLSGHVLAIKGVVLKEHERTFRVVDFNIIIIKTMMYCDEIWHVIQELVQYESTQKEFTTIPSTSNQSIHWMYTHVLTLD